MWDIELNIFGRQNMIFEFTDNNDITYGNSNTPLFYEKFIVDISVQYTTGTAITLVGSNRAYGFSGTFIRLKQDQIGRFIGQNNAGGNIYNAIQDDNSTHLYFDANPNFAKFILKNALTVTEGLISMVINMQIRYSEGGRHPSRYKISFTDNDNNTTTPIPVTDGRDLYN